MKNGIIMEINERFLTVLTPEGEFLRARKLNQSYEIGQEIAFYPIEIKVKKNSFHFNRGKAIIAVAMVLMISIGSFIPFYENNKVYAYMSIGANRSVEIGVNKHMQVVELVSNNRDGKKVIEEIKAWKKKDVQTVTNKVLKEIDEQGFTKKQKEVVITTVYNGNRKKKVDQQLEQKIDKIKEEVKHKKITVTVNEATKKERDAAKKQDIPSRKDPDIEQSKSGQIKKSSRKESKHQKESYKNVHQKHKQKNDQKSEKKVSDKSTKRLDKKSNHFSHNKSPNKPKKPNSPKVNKGNNQNKNNHSHKQFNKKSNSDKKHKDHIKKPKKPQFENQFHDK